MEAKLIFYPVLLQVGLTLCIYLYLALAKSRAVKLDQVDLSRRALHADAWPDSVLQISNNLRNQFEAPVLFYALTLMLWALGAVDAISLSLAWGFSLTRLLHAAIHLRSNRVPNRRAVFTVGCVLLLLMLGQCLWALLTA